MGDGKGDKVVEYGVINNYINTINKIKTKLLEIRKKQIELKETINNTNNNNGVYFGQASDDIDNYFTTLGDNLNKLIGYVECCSEYMNLCKFASQDEEKTVQTNVENVTNVKVES